MNLRIKILSLLVGTILLLFCITILNTGITGATGSMDFTTYGRKNSSLKKRNAESDDCFTERL
jgi:hypothetical protein